MDFDSVKIKIKELVVKNHELEPLYNEYISRKREDFSGYDFRQEAIEMLREDKSQSAMAEEIGVSRRTFSTKIKQLQARNKDNILGRLLEEHAERKIKRVELTDEEKVIINLELDKYEEQFPVGTTRYERRDSQEIRREYLQRVINVIDKLRREGVTLKELSERRVISEANYRKYKGELEALSQILDTEQEKEQ